MVGVSTDSHFSHLAWINTPRKQGGLGGLAYPLLSDFSKKISDDYGVLLEDAGLALRGLFIIDREVGWTGSILLHTIFMSICTCISYYISILFLRAFFAR